MQLLYKQLKFVMWFVLIIFKIFSVLCDVRWTVHCQIILTFSLSFKSEIDKNQMMGEIKVALKREMKTEGEQLVLEILQCRNITYKFKSPDHLPGNGTNAKTQITAGRLKYNSRICNSFWEIKTEEAQTGIKQQVECSRFASWSLIGFMV